MAHKLGEVLGAIISFLLVYVGSAVLLGGFIGITAYVAVSVYGLF